jgi:hypothetical protein
LGQHAAIRAEWSVTGLAVVGFLKLVSVAVVRRFVVGVPRGCFGSPLFHLFEGLSKVSTQFLAVAEH